MLQQSCWHCCMPVLRPLNKKSACPQGYKTMELYVGDAEVRSAYLLNTSYMCWFHTKSC